MNVFLKLMYFYEQGSLPSKIIAMVIVGNYLCLPATDEEVQCRILRSLHRADTGR